MQIRNNERGSALMVVLLLVVVFTLLGMSLLTMNTSAAKQLNKKEEQVQARHLAEMGILHYRAEVGEMLTAHNKELKKNKEDSKSLEVLIQNINFQKTKFCSELATKTTTSGPSEGYTVTLKSKSGIDNKGCTYDEKNKIIKLTVNSRVEDGHTGKAEIDANLFIKLPDVDFTTVAGEIPKDGSGTQPRPPNEDVKVNNGDFYLKNGPDPIVEGSLYVKGENSKVTVEPGRNNGGTVMLKKDLYIEGVLDFTNHGCIAVLGDFTAKKHLYLGSHANLFIYGNANLPSSTLLQNDNAKIYVSGNVYIDGVLQVPKPSKYKDVPDTEKSNGCDLPGPRSTPSEIKVFEWELSSEIEARYW